ncbi:MAG: substrate-binding domain-containing protein, partial [Planctomycetota bacterium]
QSPAWWLIAALLAGCGGRSRPSLMVYCAAVARQPMEAIAERYEAERGVRVELQVGGSNTLLSQAIVSRAGDLLLVADGHYVSAARERGLIARSAVVGVTRPVLVVADRLKGRVQALDDLSEGGVRLALADPEAAAIGRCVKRLMQRAGRWEEIKTAVEQRGVFTPTVTGVANAIEVGGADAGFVWQAIAHSRGGLHVVDTRELSASPAPSAARSTAQSTAQSTIELAVLRGSANAGEASDFLEFVTLRGREAFAASGFEPPANTGPRANTGPPANNEARR